MTILMWLLIIAGISWIGFVIWHEYVSDHIPLGGVTNSIMFGIIMIVWGVLGLSSGGPPEGFQECGVVEEGFMPKRQIINPNGMTWCSKEIIYMQVIEDDFYAQ